MSQLINELRASRLKKITVTGLESPVWIRKISPRLLVQATGTAFVSAAHVATKEGEQAGAKITVDPSQYDTFLGAFEEVVRIGVVAGMENGAEGDIESASQTILSTEDVSCLSVQQQVEIASAIIEHSGMNEEARVIARHFHGDSRRADGGGSSPQAGEGVREETLGAP